MTVLFSVLAAKNMSVSEILFIILIIVITQYFYQFCNIQLFFHWIYIYEHCFL